MTPFKSTTRMVIVRKADLPPITVEANSVYTTAVCEGESQRFYMLPGDDPGGLYCISAAYLAMAVYLEDQQRAQAPADRKAGS